MKFVLETLSTYSNSNNNYSMCYKNGKIVASLTLLTYPGYAIPGPNFQTSETSIGPFK